MYSTEEILNKINEARARTSTRENTIFSENSREVSKEEKIKRSNYVSRLSEEIHPLEVSSETYLLASGTSDNLTSSSSLVLNPQKDFVNMITPATTSSRTLTGITVQHAKTKTGIKLSLNIQEESDIPSGQYSKITAELKRHSRLRELKDYEGDSAEFAKHYRSTINDIKELKPAEGKKFCIGRTHARGSRSAWIADTMVLGEVDENDIITKIFFYYGIEEYVIEFDQELSPRQKDLYHSCGIYGEIKKGKVAPTLQSIKKDIWK